MAQKKEKEEISGSNPLIGSKIKLFKMFQSIWRQIKYFFVNPFWLSGAVLILMVFAILINAAIWYLYIKNYRDLIGIVQIGYSSAVLILNILLGNIVFRKEKLISIILLSAGLIIQILFIIFLRFFAMTQAF